MKLQHNDSWTGSAPQVTQRLYLVIVLFIGGCLAFGGFMMMTKNSDISTYSLATAAERLYKRSTKIPIIYIEHNTPGQIEARLLELFHCNTTKCGTIHRMGLPGLVRNCVIHELENLERTLKNAKNFLESLR